METDIEMYGELLELLYRVEEKFPKYDLDGSYENKVGWRQLLDQNAAQFEQHLRKKNKRGVFYHWTAVYRQREATRCR